VEGTVTVDFIVDADGRVSKITAIQSPDPRLSWIAALQLKQWKFAPGTKGGVPASEPMRVPFVFRPREDASSKDSPASTARTQGMEALGFRDYDDAIEDFTEALRLEPGAAAILEARARAYSLRNGRTTALEKPAAKFPEIPGAQNYDGERSRQILLEVDKAGNGGDLAAAIADLTEAIRLDPANSHYLGERGFVYLQMTDTARAIQDYDAVIRLSPDGAGGYFARASVEHQVHRDEEALDDVNEALRLAPDSPGTLYLTAEILYREAKYKEAADRLARAIRLKPGYAAAGNLLGWLEAVCPDATLRDGRQAVAHATEACAATKWGNAAYLDALAAAYAETGDFPDAVDWETQALAFPTGPAGDRADLRARLELYQARKPYREPGPDLKAVAWEDLAYHTFQSVWSTVNDSYFDPGFGGVDWAAVREKYRQRLPAARDERKLRWLLESMLLELHRTHFSIVPRDSAVFDPSQRSRIGSIGTQETFLNGQVVVSEVRKGLPGAAAGIKPGDAVLGVDGLELAPILESLAKAGYPRARAGLYLTQYVESRLGGAVGSRVKLRLEGPGGATREVAVTCGPADGIWSEPIGSFPAEPVRIKAARGADGIALLRFSAFVPQVMAEIRTFLRSLRPADGLVIDLRDNPGGVTDMACGIGGLLLSKDGSLGAMHMRKGLENFDVYPQAGAFGGPVAILVDSQSASTSEILAAGLQESRRARVFGESSAGAALPSFFKRLPTGDLLQYAIADMTTPAGRMIEGHGVVPDVAVALTRADLAGGRDPVAAAAQAWLETERRLK
jgi:carboxyl-terminal processing protease